MPLSVILVLLSFVVLLVGLKLHSKPRVHIAMMVSVMLFDLCFPFWLYMTHDWVKRLIDDGELLSFAIWAHMFLVLSLYALYVLQIQAGLALVKGNQLVRASHLLQGKGIVVARLFVLISGAMLIAPK